MLSDGLRQNLCQSRIAALIPLSEVPAEACRIDAGGHIVAPGLIDLQIYGAGGRLFSAEPTTGTQHAIGEAILASGTTGFMLTLATNPMDVYFRAIDAVKTGAHPAFQMTRSASHSFPRVC